MPTKEEVSPEQITNLKVNFRPEKQQIMTPMGKTMLNALVPTDLQWTYLAAKADGGTTTPTGGGSGNGGTTPTPTGDGDEG